MFNRAVIFTTPFHSSAKLFCCAVLASLALIAQSLAENIQPLDLKPFVGPSHLDRINAEWLLPRGRQVLDGVPFQMDGIIELYGTGAGQRNRPGRTNVTDIPVGQVCERIHLLAATDDTGQDTNLVATLRLNYADGTDAELKILFGFHVRRWIAAWHKTSSAPRDPATHVAWAGQHTETAKGGEFARLFHSVFTNPSPEKVVKSISLESAKARAGLWVAGLSLGSADAAPLPDTVPLSPNFPDLRPRNGEPASISGVVRMRDGKPLKDVRVRVMGARPFGTNDRETRTEDPAAGTETVSDADGKFTLPPLSDNQLYRLMAFGEAVETAFYRGADPKAGPIEIRMETWTEPKIQAFTARGRVIDPDGKPIAGAVVEFNSVKQGMGTSFSSGSYAEFPDQLVTRPNGEFVMSRAKAFDAVQVEITAPNLAPMKAWLGATNATHTVQLNTGCRVRGRLLNDGQPLAGVQVGVSGKEREASVYAGHYEATTGTNGVFQFNHLASGTAWWLYGKMASLKKKGTFRPQPVTTLMNGTDVDVGDIELIPALTLAGKVQTRTGEPLPSGVRVYVGRDDVADSQNVTLDKEGQFSFEGLPPGLVEINVNQQGWKLSGVNRSLDNWNAWRLVGLLEQSKNDLLIVIERGARDYNNSTMGNGQLPPPDQSRSRPLFGAEPGGPPFLKFAGKVVDDNTGQPIKTFKVVPGRKPPVGQFATPRKALLQTLTEPFRKKVTPWNELPYWDYARQEMFTNGEFAVSFELLSSTPILQVEAAGYDPFTSEPMDTPTNGLVVRLKTGTGPSGIVLLPDGKPAAGAKVIYGATRDQFGLNGTELSAYGGTNWLRVTGPDGKFSFPARPEGQLLYAAHASGWISEPARNDKDGIKLRLQPWAIVCGTLQHSNGTAMAGVPLHLGKRYDGQLPHINSALRVTTDAKGGFCFSNVPPERLELSREIPFGPGNGWTHQLQTWLEVKAGGTNNMGKVIYDSPPPLPMVEQLKKTLGL